ncbi:hypothetical protein VTP01DRAFT_10978 [Rhizomucor pusillus]|uniref:uncharacterized protein n=1 Tax=Rhizomucor pusillus TaxID=4840 RepID=UPI0037421451
MSRRSRFKVTHVPQDASAPMYELPTLSNAQLLLCLQEMQLTITENDLLHPTPERIQRLYENILELIVPWRVRSMLSTRIRLEQSYDHPELYRDLTGIILLFKQIKQLLSEIRFRDITLRDLTDPAPHRLARILSALINYAKFREGSWETFEEYARKTDELAEQASDQYQVQEDLQRQILEHREKLRQEEPAIRQAEADNSELERQLRDKRRVADSLQAQLNELKENRQGLKDTLQNTQYELMTISSDIQKYRTLVQFNPERAKENVATLRENVKQEKERLEAAERRILTLDFKFGRMDEIHRDLDDILKLIFSINANMKRLEELTREHAVQKEDMEKLNMAIRNISVREQQCRQKLEGIEAKKNSQQKELEARQKQMQKQIAEYDRQMQQVNEEVEKLRQEANAYLEPIDKLEKEINSILYAHEHDIKTLERKMEHLRLVLDAKLKNINDITA